MSEYIPIHAEKIRLEYQPDRETVADAASVLIDDMRKRVQSSGGVWHQEPCVRIERNFMTGEWWGVIYGRWYTP